MNTNRMKLGLVYIFSENNKLSKEAKLQLIKFIEIADEHQVKILAMDGEVIDKSSLDETARSIVDDRFKLSGVLDTLKKASTDSLDAAFYIKTVKEFGSSAAEAMKDLKDDYKRDMMAVRRKCSKYREVDRPDKEKACLQKQTAKVKANFAKWSAKIKLNASKKK